MKFATFSTLIAILAAVALAADEPKKLYIISYPSEAGTDKIEAMIQTVKDNGGEIKHRYKLLKYALRRL